MGEPTQAELVALWKREQQRKAKDAKRTKAIAEATQALIKVHRGDYDVLLNKAKQAQGI